MKTFLLALLATSLLFTLSCGSARKSATSNMGGGPSIGPNYKYNELMIKDYDEMSEMVQSFVRNAKEAAGEDGTANEDEAIGHLRNGLKLILSRPDSDNMVAKLVPEVRRMMIGFNAYESSMAAIADEAMYYVSSDNAAPSIQSTSLFILDNILGEVKPEIESNAQLRAVVERIRDAKLDVSRDVQNERKIRGMFSTKSPSDTAGEILKRITEREKAQKKKKK